MTQAELQAQLDDIADRRAGIVSLPMGGSLDTIRRAVWRQCRNMPQDVLSEVDRAVTPEDVIRAVLRIEEVELEWV